MTQMTPIGRGTELVALEVADGVHIEQIALGEPSSSPGEEDSPLGVAARVARALAQPNQFLPLAEMVVPGDTVAIALDEGLPQPESIVAGILQVLEPCELGQIHVVLPASTGEEAVVRLKSSLPASVSLTVHNLTDRSAFGYLGADADAEAIRINRTLADADLVLPVNVMRVTDPLLGGPSGDALFPGMVDDAQRNRLQRFTARAIARRENYHDERAASQAHQVRWNLGVQLMMSVEVTCGGGIGQIIVSSPETLREAVRAHYATHRQSHAAESEAADVVVACVEGDAAQQTMENLMRAALVARSYAAPSGTIVLVSTLERLGPLRSLDEQADAEPDGDEPDAGHATPGTLSQAEFATRVLHDLINEIDTSRRYLLMFGGDWEAAEAFGFGVVQDEAALVRLINQNPNCCVLHAAQTAADATALAATRR